MNETKEVINITKSPNSISFRYGGTGSDVKLYFDSAEDLEKQLESMADKAEPIQRQLNRFKAIMNGE